MKRLTTDSIFNSAHLSSDLAGKTVRGGMSTIVGEAVHFVLQISGTIVLARLLTPADYGLIAMVTVAVNFATMFKDAGLSMATVQKDSISHDQISTLFWINVLISIVLGFCVLVCSPLVAAFYSKPELTAVMASLSISFIISGVSIQHSALLRRHMHFGSLAIIKIVSQISNIVLTVLLALFGWSYWALVGGSLITAIVTTGLTFFFCPWVPGRIQKRTGVRDMLWFGSHLTGFDFVNYFARNADNILIGRFIGADALGFYSKAYQLLMMPISQIRAPIVNVMLPVLSSLCNQPKRYVKYYTRVVDIIATLSIPLALYCFIEAEFLIGLILGQQWLGAIAVFRILATFGLIQAVATTRGLVLLSHGFSKRYFYWGCGNAILNVVSFVIGIPYGAEGVALSYTIVNYIILIPSLFYCFQKTPITVTLFMKALFLPLVISSVAGLAVIYFKYIWMHDTNIMHILCLFLFVTVYVGLSACRQSVRETSMLVLDNVRK